MRPVISLIRFIVYSNIFVSICAIALTHLSYILLHLPKSKNHPILLLVFCATYFTYNIQRAIRLDYSLLIGKNIGIRLGWITRNRGFLIASSLFVILIGCCTLFFLNISCLIALIPLAAISLLYVLPFIPSKKGLLSLRKIPFAKIIIIAFVWTIVTVLLPYINEYGFSQLHKTNLFFVLISRFIFILAITIPFDIRDVNFDKLVNLKTIPSTLGIKASVILSELLLVGYAFLKFWQFQITQQISFAQFIAFLIAIIISMYIISYSFKKRSELYYSGVVESTMIILHLGILILEY